MSDEPAAVADALDGKPFARNLCLKLGYKRPIHGDRRVEEHGNVRRRSGGTLHPRALAFHGSRRRWHRACERQACPCATAIENRDFAVQQKQMGSRSRGRPCRVGAALRTQDVLGAQEQAVECAVRSEVRHKLAGGGFRGIINHDDLITDIPGETAHRPDGQPDLTRRVTREDQNGNKRCLALSFGSTDCLAEAGSLLRQRQP